MRATSRVPVLVTVGALVIPFLAGTGCETPSLGTLPGVGSTAARGVPRDTVTMLPPRPIDDGPAGVVWRASSRSTSADPAQDNPGPVVAVSRQSGGKAHGPAVMQADDLPRELSKVTMPAYRVEPPDVLLINTLHVVPRPPYKIEPLDELTIQAPPAQLLPNEPIRGAYAVGPDGQVDLGNSYGRVAVVGLTTELARDAIKKHLVDQHGIKPPAVVVSLAQARGLPPVRGEHAVRLDGMVNLGSYGDAYVAGMTLAEAKVAVEAQLGKKLLNPEVAVDVFAHGSKVYYVIFDGGEAGQQVLKVPYVGGETVLDAVSELHALPGACAAKRVWIARPVPGQVGCRHILSVDWVAITEGATSTNYQLFPGDRVYVKVESGYALHDGVSRMKGSLGRLFGFGPTETGN